MTTHRLPEFDERPSLGGRLVRRTVSLTLVGLVLLAVVTAATLFTVEMEITVAASGRLEPLEVRKIHVVSPGRIEEVLVESGERVRAGQTLARLDDFALRQELDRLRLEARHQGSRPDVPDAERELLEQSILFREQLLERLELVAPADGVVLSEEVDQLAGVVVTEGQLIFEIGSAEAWKTVLRVPEREIDSVRTGDEVKLRIPAVDDPEVWMPENLTARVSFVGSELLEGSAPGHGLYRVDAEIDTERVPAALRERFRRGMTVEAHIVTRSARAVDLVVLHLKRQIGFDG